MRFDVRIVSGKALDTVGMITIQMRQQHVVESSESHQVYLNGRVVREEGEAILFSSQAVTATLAA